MLLADYYGLDLEEQKEFRPYFPCKKSRVRHATIVTKKNLNPNDTLYGGQLMKSLDNICTLSVIRHTRLNCVTASCDSIEFIHPILENHSVTFESYISGVGSSSLEVFCKILGEDLFSRDRYLGAIAFMTFVCYKEGGEKVLLPKVYPESREEKTICQGYEDRRRKRLEEKKDKEEITEAIIGGMDWLKRDGKQCKC